MNIGVLTAILRLKDTLTPALARAAAGIKAVGAKMVLLGQGMRSAGAALTTGLTLPLVGMAAVAGIAFGSFEKSMNRVKALTGETGMAFSIMEKQAKSLGKTTQFSASEAADAMGFLAMAGFEATEIIAAMPGVLQLAAAAQLDLASAADITSNILTGYGRTVSQVNETNDILVKAFTSANTDLVQLGQAFKFVGPVAKSAGVTFEETTAILALMGNAGIQASMAGTALRGAITKLINPTNKASRAMARVGIHATDAEGNLLPLENIIQQLGDRSVSTADLMTIFGLRAGPAMAGLVSQGADAVRELTGELGDAAGVAGDIATVQMEGLAGAFVRLKSAATGAFIDIGEKLEPALTLIIDKLITLSNWIADDVVPAFTSLSPTMQMVVGALVGIAAAAGPVLSILGIMVTSIGGLLTALGGTAGLVGMLGTAVTFLTGPVGIAIALGVLLMSFKPARDIILSVGRIIKNIFVAQFKLAIRVIKGVVTWVKEFLLGFKSMQVAINFVSKAFGMIKGGVGKFTDTLKDAADATETWGESAEEAAARGLREVAEATADLNDDLEQLIIDMVDSEVATSDLTDMMERLEADTETTDEQMEIFANSLELAKVKGTRLTPELQNLIDEFLDLEGEAEAAAGAVGDELTPAMIEAQEAADKLGKDAQNLADELSGKGLTREVEVLTLAWEKLEPELQSNKKVMEEVGEQALTLQEEGADLTGVMLQLAESAKEAAADIKAADEEAKHAVAIQEIIDRATRADIPQAVADLQESWEGLTEAQRENTAVLIFYRDKMEEAEEAGGVFEGTLGELDFTTVNLTESQEALETAAAALAKRFSKSELQGQVAVLELAIENLRETGDYTEEQMKDLAKQALALRDDGAELADGMDELADSVDDVKDKLEDQEGAWNKFKFIIKKNVSGLNDIFKAAFEGGGGLAGAIESFATGVLEDLLRLIPVVGEFLSQFAGAFVAAGKRIWGGIKSMFGGPSGAEKEARKLNKVFEDTIIANLNQIQLAEAGGRRWAQVVIGVRDSYIAAGKTSEQASDAVARLWAATKIGPEAVQPIIDEIQNVINTGKEASEALAKITQEAVTGLQGLVIEARQSGELLPAHLEPYLVTLREAGLLTQQDADLLRQMADEAHIDWQAMQTAAEKYGISLEELGPKFDRKRLEDAAQAIVADWEILNQEGVNTKAVLEGMSDSVQDLINDAANAGVDIPHNMQPIIEQMIDQGLLTDENGKKLTDMSELEFAEPLEAKFSALIDKIDDLIDKLMGDLADAVDDVATGVKEIPQTITIDVGWDVHKFDMPYIDPISIPFEYQNIGSGPGQVPGFQGGTHGQFVDFGAGSLAMLHGKERITPLGEAGSSADGKVFNKQLLSEVSGLRTDMKNLPLHLRDAILLSK